MTMPTRPGWFFIFQGNHRRTGKDKVVSRYYSNPKEAYEQQVRLYREHLFHGRHSSLGWTHVPLMWRYDYGIKQWLREGDYADVQFPGDTCAQSESRGSAIGCEARVSQDPLELPEPDELVAASAGQRSTPEAMAILRRVGLDDDDAALLFALTISRLEGVYGMGFGAGVENWGAVHCAEAPRVVDGEIVCDDGCVPHAERGGDGELLPLGWCFRSYASPEEGAADFVRELFDRRPSVRRAASAGDYQRAVEQMAATTYFAPYSFWRSYWKIVERTLPVVAELAPLPYPPVVRHGHSLEAAAVGIGFALSLWVAGAALSRYA